MRRFAFWLLPLLFALPAAADHPVAKGQFDLFVNGVNKGRERYRVENDKKKDRWLITSDLYFKLPFPQAKRGYINFYMYPEYSRSLSTGTFTEFKYRQKIEDFSETDLVEADQSALEVARQSQQVYDFTESIQQGTDDVMRDHIDFGMNAGGVRVTGNIVRFTATKVNLTRTKDETLKGPLAILDPMVPSIYIPLLDQLQGEGPTWEFGFALPQYLKYRPGQIDCLGVEESSVRGQPYLLRHYEVKVQGNLFSAFWVDRAGRVIQVLVPKDGLIAVIADYTPQAFERAEPRVIRQSIETKSSFDEKRITVPCGSISVGATLTVPSGTGPFPAALLVQDLGPTDRDGNRPGASRVSSEKQVAYALAEKGIASLRWDSRGVGDSGGDAERSALPERSEEVAALVGWLRSSAQIRPGAIFVLATGLGGWAALDAGPTVPAAGFVLVGYPGKPVLRLWKEQISVVQDPVAVRKAYADLEELEGALDGSSEWAAYRGGRRYLPAVRRLAAVDPLALLQSRELPALLVYPDKDLVVQPFHRDIVSAVLKPAQKALSLSGVDHDLLKVDSENGPTGIVDGASVGVLADWMLERTKQSP